MEITADQIFCEGIRAPRGTYLSLQTGVVHRLSRPTTLPLGGPFRRVAPTEAIGPMEPSVIATTAAKPVERTAWPDEAAAPAKPESLRWFEMLASYRFSRGGTWY